jgi:hypothetical protein
MDSKLQRLVEVLLVPEYSDMIRGEAFISELCQDNESKLPVWRSTSGGIHRK